MWVVRINFGYSFAAGYSGRITTDGLRLDVPLSLSRTVVPKYSLGYLFS